MQQHEIFIRRCIELAMNGLGYVSPNPLVGAVLVNNGKIIGEGYHKEFGEAHAEVNAINSVKDRSLIPASTLYVNLEPCAHYGKTPPCAELIIKEGIRRVVFGMNDPFPKVAGKGEEMLREAGVEVIKDVLKAECLELNRRFVVAQTKGRPYIILKWAESRDGFLGKDPTKEHGQFEMARYITCAVSQRLVHKWRAEEPSILVGFRTAFYDNPTLTVRFWKGKNPLRILLDRTASIPAEHNVYNEESNTLVFTEGLVPVKDNIFIEELDFSANRFPELFAKLYQRNIQSVLVEGGAVILQRIIDLGIWDEARVFTAPHLLQSGISAPAMPLRPVEQFRSGIDTLSIFRNSK